MTKTKATTARQQHKKVISKAITNCIVRVFIHKWSQTTLFTSFGNIKLCRSTNENIFNFWKCQFFHCIQSLISSIQWTWTTFAIKIIFYLCERWILWMHFPRRSKEKMLTFWECNRYSLHHMCNIRSCVSICHRSW